VAGHFGWPTHARQLGVQMTHSRQLGVQMTHPKQLGVHNRRCKASRCANDGAGLLDVPQVTLIKQEKVACLIDNEATLGLDPKDPYAVQVCMYVCVDACARVCVCMQMHACDNGLSTVSIGAPAK